jgi:hypothetical protein
MYMLSRGLHTTIFLISLLPHLILENILVKFIIT